MNNHIVSLGPFCITKDAINSMNFYSKTMPFDWMFSSLLFIKDVIKDDFNLLLNKEYIKSTNPCWDKNKSYNILYNENILKSKNITNHFLIKNELAEYYNFHMWNHYNLLDEEQYNKYIKYVSRFKSMIQSEDLKIFLYVQYYDDTINEIIEFNNYINETIKNYKLLCINCKKVNIKTNNLICSYNDNNLYIYDLEIEIYKNNLEEYDLEEIKQVINSLIN